MMKHEERGNGSDFFDVMLLAEPLQKSQSPQSGAMVRTYVYVE